MIDLVKMARWVWRWKTRPWTSLQGPANLWRCSSRRFPVGTRS